MAWLGFLLMALARVSQAIFLSQETPAQAETRVSRSTCGIMKKQKEMIFREREM